MLFMFTMVFIGTLNAQLRFASTTRTAVYIGGQGGCYNIVPVYDWIKRCIISIFMCVRRVALFHD